MKQSVFGKAVLRQPVRTALLLLLTGAMTFVFSMRVGEYELIGAETWRLSGYYRSVGQIEPIRDNTDRREVTRLLEADPRVESVNCLTVTSAVMEEFCNADDDGSLIYGQETFGLFPEDYNWYDVIFYGVLTDPRESETGYYYRFQVDEVLAGYPELVSPGKTVILVGDWEMGFGEALDAAFHSLKTGERYLVRGSYDPTSKKCFYREDVCQLIGKQLLGKVGEITSAVTSDAGTTVEYIDEETVVITTTGGGGRPGQYAELYQYKTTNRGYYVDEPDDLAFLPAPPGFDLAASGREDILEEIARVRDNQRAMNVLAADDVSRLSFLQETGHAYDLMEGRYPDLTDSKEGNLVCAVNRAFAEARGVKVGDALTLTLRNIYSEHGYAGYQGETVVEMSMDLWATSHPVKLRALCPDYSPANYWNEPQKGETSPGSGETWTGTFTVVGLYTSSTDASQTYGRNDLFLPAGVLPDSFVPTRPNDGTVDAFVLAQGVEEDEFLSGTGETLTNLGYRALFPESNAASFASSAGSIRSASLRNVLLFAALLALTMALCAFLFFRFRRKDVAVSRALGVPVGRCALAAALPLILVGSAGAVGGAVLGWRYADSHAAQILQNLAAFSQGEPAKLDPAVMIPGCLGAVGLLLAAALLAAFLTARRRPLEQLQGRK